MIKNVTKRSFGEEEEQKEEEEKRDDESFAAAPWKLWCSGAERRRRNPDFKSIDI